MGVRVHRRRHGLVRRIAPVGLYGVEVEALDIEEGAEQAGVEHLDDAACDASGREAADDALRGRGFLQGGGDGEGNPARAGLEGEAVHEESGSLDDVGRRRGDLQPVGLGGDARGPGGDLPRVADGLDSHHVVHLVLRDPDRATREGHEVVRHGDHPAGIADVRHRVAEGSARRPAVHAVDVAAGVRGGRRDEGGVDPQLAARDGARPAAMRLQDRRRRQRARADGLGDRPAT
jgi:hypothetical protein